MFLLWPGEFFHCWRIFLALSLEFQAKFSAVLLHPFRWTEWFWRFCIWLWSWPTPVVMELSLLKIFSIFLSGWRAGSPDCLLYILCSLYSWLMKLALNCCPTRWRRCLWKLPNGNPKLLKPCNSNLSWMFTSSKLCFVRDGMTTLEEFWVTSKSLSHKKGNDLLEGTSANLQLGFFVRTIAFRLLILNGAQLTLLHGSPSKISYHKV